jgi:hypothetical protein
MGAGYVRRWRNRGAGRGTGAAWRNPGGRFGRRLKQAWLPSPGVGGEWDTERMHGGLIAVYPFNPHLRRQMNVLALRLDEYACVAKLRDGITPLPSSSDSPGPRRR